MNRLWINAKTFWNHALDLLFPINCQGCGLEGNYLCLSCQQKIEPPLERCLVCEKNSPLGRTHLDCVCQKLALAGLMVAANYEEPGIKNLIWNLKYNSVAEISKNLATILVDYFVKRDLLDYFAGSFVIPVPLHKKRFKIRGFNQAELLAQNFAKSLGFECLKLLQKTKATKRQVELEGAERLKNLEGAFSVLPMPPSLGERKIILVDDVATTGATLNECAKVLRAQGAGEIWGLVVARN